eukprot:CAMPEP_0177579166 /NCGR_PEP_ID=MMETSP0419_2-20121207/791_1 /TAXON_ID=582737 /ORGANISM="Tetraselmis sp., Strain GSL018" /LENGTH=67 /DNA_ID=CAMNT_0019067767 /DNA_START=216 /DNA_END=416 /DNA_ORIENTATION=-
MSPLNPKALEFLPSHLTYGYYSEHGEPEYMSDEDLAELDAVDAWIEMLAVNEINAELLYENDILPDW